MLRNVSDKMKIKKFFIEFFKKTTRALSRFLFDREIPKGLNGEVKNILLINWNGMLGDAIISSCLISAIKSQSSINIHVITTENLSKIYLENYRVDSVYTIKKGANFTELYKAAKFHKFCDTIIPLIGRMQWRDIFFVGVVRPSNFLSIDDSLKMSNFQLGKEVENMSIDETFRLFVKKILPNAKYDNSYIIPDSNINLNCSEYLLFNPFASRKDKSLSVGRSVSALKYLANLMPKKRIYILYSPATLHVAKDIVEKVSFGNIQMVDEITDIEKAIAYVKNADYVISVDTSIVHIAYGLNIKTVAIFPETECFNQWLPPKKDNIEFVFSKSKIINGAKNMNVFDNREINYAINRLKNSLCLSDGLSIFLYYDKLLKDMPSSHRMNVMNFYSRFNGGRFRIILTNLIESSEGYIENFIELPCYFKKIKEKISDPSAVNGNQSDIIRLRLLEKYGGAYFDTSTIILRNCLSELYLYRLLHSSPEANFAGYSNVTFVRKKSDGSCFFNDGKDGIELGLLYSRKESPILKIFNREIDRYWSWKSPSKTYTNYPPFIKADLQKASFLNEYHIHYSIYHLIITTNPGLSDNVITQSIHMKHKENSLLNGPNTLTDMFCRGDSAYGPGNPEKLLECFKDGLLRRFDGAVTTLENRVEIVEGMELISIPGYMRKALEAEFATDSDYLDKRALYSYVLKHTAPIDRKSNKRGELI